MNTKLSKFKMKTDIICEISWVLSMNFRLLITYSIYFCPIQKEELLLAKFFVKNLPAERMLESCMNYYRTCINYDSPEKIAQKASQRENKNKYSLSIMKGDSQAQFRKPMNKK